MHFLDKCTSSDQAVTVINKLASDLVGGWSSRMELHAAAEAVDSRLRHMQPLIDKASAAVEGVTPSPLEIANAVGTEANLLPQRRDRGGFPAEVDNSSSLRDDAIASALTTANFYRCESTVGVADLNISTAEGRRKGIEAGFLSGPRA